jgi:BASS family bile acid:Na+ symporter
MTLQDAIIIAAKASIMLLVFSLGLSATERDATYLFRNPGKLARSLFAMDVLMPAFAVFAIAITALPPPVKIALAALSVSPIPPLMPVRATKMGGTHEYAIGLLFAASIIALVFVPLAIGLLGAIFGVEAHVPVSAIALVMGTLVLGPLVAGIFVRHNFPHLAERLTKPLNLAALILVLICILPVVVTMWPQMVSLAHDGTLAVFVAFVLVGLAVGHFYGGPDPNDRTVLAIATSARHPGCALTIATASFPEEKLVLPAIIIYLLVSIVASIPYTYWRKHRAAALPHAPAAPR